MWTVAIAGVVVAGLVLAKLGRLLRVGGRTLALIALGVGAFFWYRSRREDREASRQRIPVASVELADVKLTPQTGSSGRYALVARVRNKSPAYTLSGVNVAVTIKDCGKVGTCETLAQQVEHIPVTIPPGQSRDIRDDVVLKPAPVARGRFAWSHQVVSTEGK